VLTDVLARFARLRNPDREVIFTTGTDEHGLKIQQAAKAQNVGEEEFCARVSERFKVSACIKGQGGGLIAGPGAEGQCGVYGLRQDIRSTALQGCRTLLGERRLSPS